jgi:rubrerythrin
MPSSFVTVGRFTQVLAAQQAKALLEEEGVPAFLLGDITGGSLPGLGDHIGGFEIQVAQADAERAYEILEEGLGEDDLDAIREPGADELGAWTCSLCGGSVGATYTACPSCGTPTNAIQVKGAISTVPRTRRRVEEPPATPLEEDAGKEDRAQGWTCLRCQAVVSYEFSVCQSCGATSEAVQSRDDALTLPPALTGPDIDQEDLSPEALQRRFADDLARRALRSALIGLLICPPLLHLYSGYLLLRLAFLPGDLSSYARWRALLAFLIDVPVLLLIGLLLRPVIVTVLQSYTG